MDGALPCRRGTVLMSYIVQERPRSANPHLCRLRQSLLASLLFPSATFCDHLPRFPPRWLDIYSRCRLWPYSHRHNNNATSAQEQRIADHQSSCLAWPLDSHHVVCLEMSASLDRPAGTLTQEIYTSTDVQTSTTRTRVAHTSAGPTAVSIQRRTVN
jgi:hypothetical protein